LDMLSLLAEFLLSGNPNSCLSTTFTEYNSLSQALCVVLPICSLILELTKLLCILQEIWVMIHARALHTARDLSDDTCKSFQQQQWSLLVGNNSPPHRPHQVLPCKISPLLGLPWPRTLWILPILTKYQCRDYMTKGMVHVPFEHNGFLVQLW
jgi:hypothetical protein